MKPRLVFYVRIVSIDVGTSYIKAASTEFNEQDKTLITLSTVNVRQQAVTDGLVHEHMPSYVLGEVVKLVKHLVRTSGVPDVLVFSVYLFSAVLLTRSGEFVSNIITWLDRRSESSLDYVLRNAEDIYMRTGCPPLYIYTLPKILYMLRVNPEVVRSSLIADAKSLIMSYFTGEVVTDYSTASGTYQLMNIWNLKWDDYVLSIVGLDESQLPRLEEGDYVTWVEPGIASTMGIPEKTPVVLGLFDGGSMIFGLSGGTRSVGVVNMGTSSMLRVNSPSPVIDKSSMSIQSYYLYRNTWIPGLGLNNCGIVLEYLAGTLGLTVEQLVEKAREVSPENYAEAQTPLIIPLLYPERHPQLSKSTGVWIAGMREGLNVPLLVCSTLEGLVLLLRFVDELLGASGARYESVVAGGKVTQIPIVREMLASALEKNVHFSEIPDATHFGNSTLAMLALNAIKVNELSLLLEKFTKEIKTPNLKLSEKLRRNYGFFKKLLHFTASFAM
jgi:gluconokinase